MAKELNETTVSMEIVYDGVKTTLTRVIANVGIEDGVCDEEAVRPSYYRYWRTFQA